MSAAKSTRTSRPKCLCGCGQAPSSTCRERKAECRSCGYVIRVTRTHLAKGTPICPCGERMECLCLEDRMVCGDEQAYSELVAKASRRYAPKPFGGVRHVHQCGGCRRLLKSPLELCRNCGYDNGAQRYVEGVSSCGEAMAF